MFSITVHLLQQVYIGCFLLMACCFSPASWAQNSADTLAESSSVITHITTGFMLSQGQSQILGSPDSTTYAIPLLISSRSGRWQATFSTHYLKVHSYANHSNNITSTQQGLGDTWVSIGYDWLEAPWLTLTLKQKFATGDRNQGLSTGQPDTHIQLEGIQQIHDKTTQFATLGYQWVGKLDGYAMQNSLYASLGLSQMLTPQDTLGLSIDFTQSTYTALQDALGTTFFVSHQLNTVLTLAGFASIDTTQTSQFGLTLTTAF